jgi:hypothetical protein
MQPSAVMSLEGIGFVLVVALFIIFGQSVGWRAAGVLQLVFSVHVLRHRKAGVAWEGREPSFFLQGWLQSL